MLFIAFALIISVGIALLISADAGSLVGMSQEQTAALIPMLVLLIVFAGGMFARRYRLSEMLGNLVVWAGLFGVALLGYTYRDDLGGVATRVVGELVPGVATVDSERGTASFRSGRDGHFKINAQINGAEVRTIFDTGASAVVLTNEDARKAGINTGVLQYSIPVSTANGTGRAAGVTLDRIEVGGIVRNNIRAFVAEAGALETSLLGMTFLRTLNGYGVSGSSLELVD